MEKDVEKSSELKKDIEHKHHQKPTQFFLDLHQHLLSTYKITNQLLSPYCSPTPLFTAEECDNIKRIGYSRPFETKQKYTSNSVTMYTRMNFILPTQETLRIYERIQRAVFDVNAEQYHFHLIGFGEPLKFMEYNETFRGFVGLHSDVGYTGASGFRKLTAVVQLTDETEYDGGDLVVQHETIRGTVTRKQGSIIIFPSFLLHEVEKVKKGIRNSLVIFAYGPPFS